MATKTLQFTVNMNGTAVSGVAELTEKVDKLSTSVGGVQKKMEAISGGSLVTAFNQGLELIGKIGGKMKEYTDAYKGQHIAETQLAQVMRNTMRASQEEIQSISDLATSQQKLGIVGDEVQLAGAKELATYIHQADTLKALLPVMNDTIAHQMAMGASQEQAVGVATMMGKVMDGQVGGLQRYGYTFDEVQKKILETGSEEEKLKTLIEVVTPVVGGMNEALAATPEGQVEAVAMAAGDLKENIGKLVVDLKAKLAPAAMRLINFAQKLIGAVESGWPVVVAATVGTMAAVSKLTHKVQAMSLSVFGSQFSWVRLAVVARASCKAIGTAIKGIPIVGWIAAGISLIISLFSLLWNKCEGFRGFLTGAWEAIKTVVANIWSVLQPVLAAVFGFIKERITKRIEAVKAFIAWARDILSRAGAWFSNVMQPVWDWFSNLWEHVRGILDKVVQFMGRIFNPIIELWNKLTGGSVKAFKSGYEKGASAVRDGKGAGPDLPGLANAPGQQGGIPGQPGSAGKTESVATGGSRSTSITINLKSLVEKIVFDGGLAENRGDMQQKVAESLLQVLNMAQASVG